MELLQAGSGGLKPGRSQGKVRPHVCLLQGTLKENCRFKVKGRQCSELEKVGGRESGALSWKVKDGIVGREGVPKVRQEGNMDKCLRTRGQLEEVEEAVAFASTSSQEVRVGSNEVGLAVVATKAIVYSAQGQGNAKQGGSGICSLTQSQNQEIEVNSSQGFWADKWPLLSKEAKECVSAAWRVGTKSR